MEFAFIKIRKATCADVDSVTLILNRSRVVHIPYAKSPYSLDEQRNWVRNSLIPSNGVVIAAQRGNDVGVLATSISENIGWIDQLYVAPGHLRQGIGSKLLAHAIATLPKPIRLWTFQQNESAIKFYRFHGFKVLKYTDGADNQEKCPDVLFELC